MDLHLEGKVIIITGGFKGIGKGITLQLAQEGASPVVINRPDSALDEFKKDIERRRRSNIQEVRPYRWHCE